MKMEALHNIHKIIEQEDTLKYIKNELAKVSKENQMLGKIQKN